MFESKPFCCSGCSQVYALLQENGLCAFYDIDKNPGITARGKFKSAQFAYLDDPAVLSKLAQYIDESLVNITFSLPDIHCASCVYLLENLHKIKDGILSSKVNFQEKTVFISYVPGKVSLRETVELLAFIGYEPSITLEDMQPKKKKSYNRKTIFQIGIAGFCFSNIMMLSFPEYFASGKFNEPGLQETFSWIIFFLSLPVLFYAASGIFSAAYKGLREKFLNVDLPIALAIVITFGRSYYEIISGTGSGYLDSGTGIIFFMLIGRWFQDKTYDALSFDRDHLSYFPLGVTVIKNGSESSIPVTKLTKNDHIVVRHNEMIAADAVLKEGEALIDYSFVTGESEPVIKKAGEVIYAGGKQKGGRIELVTVKEPSQSYITRLWNKDEGSPESSSFIHPWSKYFTIVLLSIAAIAGIYWYNTEPDMVLPVVSAVLIVACPCSLLLTTTFTFGNMLRIFGRNKLYLKNSLVIEEMAAIDTIVFDKTGTLTSGRKPVVTYQGKALSEKEEQLVFSLTGQSSHILSRQLGGYFSGSLQPVEFSGFREVSGKGIMASTAEDTVSLGSASFTGTEAVSGATRIYTRFNDEVKGFFEISNVYRENIGELLYRLKTKYSIHVLSGDNDAERSNLGQYFPAENMRFNELPAGKLEYIKNLQKKGRRVMMIGDGLNDAGALLQANAGIAVNDHASTFTPACDAIIDGNSLNRLSSLLQFAGKGKFIISISFIVSVLYNIIGISFAVRGLLSPVIAAILMPASSITIVSLATIMAGITGRRLKL